MTEEEKAVTFDSAEVFDAESVDINFLLYILPLEWTHSRADDEDRKPRKEPSLSGFLSSSPTFVLCFVNPIRLQALRERVSCEHEKKVKKPYKLVVLYLKI